MFFSSFVRRKLTSFRDFFCKVTIDKYDQENGDFADMYLNELQHLLRSFTMHYYSSSCRPSRWPSGLRVRSMPAGDKICSKGSRRLKYKYRL